MGGINIKLLLLLLFLLNIVFANDFKLTQVINIPSYTYESDNERKDLTNQNSIQNKTEETIYTIKKFEHILKSSNKKIYINIKKQISDKYYFIWNGDVKQVDNIYRADGNGTIQLIRKSDDYLSTKIKVNIVEGFKSNDINISSSSFYKCIDKECDRKEYKAKLIYTHIQEDENKTKGKEEKYIYTGTLEINDNGTIDGMGTLETDNITYSGEFKNSRITGYGTFKTKLSNTLGFGIEQQGLWKDGFFTNGYLNTIYQDGGMYRGESKNGKPDGKGTFIWKDKSKYTGNFKDGKKNGFGRYTFKDGSIYAGNYKDDKKNGFGELYIKSKDIYYKGEFKDGNFEGTGELYIQDKATYIGKFKNNQPHGRGVIVDNKDKVIKVIAIYGHIEELKKVSFFTNFPFPQANAGWLSDEFNSIKNTINTAISDSIEWVSDNSEHLINAVKGCVAGGIGGAATGAATGVAIGAAVGAAPGAIVGFKAGAIGGGVNGCIKQGLIAFDISKEHNGTYTLNDMYKAMNDEISVENAVVGAASGLVGVAALVKLRAVTTKTYQFLGISKAISSMGNFSSKVKKAICKIGYMKNTFVCQLRKKDKKKDKKNIPTLLTIASWDLSKKTNDKKVKSLFNSFSNTKKTLKKYVYNKKPYRKTIYSNIYYNSNKIPINYIPINKNTLKGKINKRAKIIEWEHIVDAENFKKTIPECRRGDKTFLSREDCWKKSTKFKLMEADPFNLAPEVGEINANRRSYMFTSELPSKDSLYIKYGLDIDFPSDSNEKKKIFISQESRGRVARAFLHMEKEHGVKLGSAYRFMRSWDKLYPMTASERYIYDKKMSLININKRYDKVNIINNFIKNNKNTNFIALQNISSNELKQLNLNQFKHINGFLVNPLNVPKIITYKISIGYEKKFKIKPNILIFNKKVALLNINKIEKKEINHLSKVIKNIKKKYQNIKIIIIGNIVNAELKLNLKKAIDQVTSIRGKEKIYSKNYQNFYTDFSVIQTNIMVNRKIKIKDEEQYLNYSISDHLPISCTFSFINNTKKNINK